MENAFAFASQDAAEIARIVARNEDNARFLRELLLQALVYERLLSSPKPTP